MAGGVGTRGRPYTDHIPKAMIRVKGKPVIEIIVRQIAASQNIDEIIIITDLEGLGGQVRNYLEYLNDIGCTITFVQDSSAGTAGDLLPVQKKIGNANFLLWFCDNLCAIDIDAMITRHKTIARSVCIAVRTRRKEETGFVKVDGNLVTEFVEKPISQLLMPECLGVYVLDSKILKSVRHKNTNQSKIDLSFDVLEPLAASLQMCVYDIGRADWIDVESPVVLERNAKMVSRILVQIEKRTRQMRLAALTQKH